MNEQTNWEEDFGINVNDKEDVIEIEGKKYTVSEIKKALTK